MNQRRPLCSRLILPVILLLFIVTLHAGVLLWTFEGIFFSASFYGREFSKPSMLQDMTPAEAMGRTTGLLGYYAGKEPLDTTGFDEREVTHLQDVAGVVRQGISLKWALTILFLATAPIAFIVAGAKPLRALLVSYVVLLILLLVLWLAPFDALFGKFHEALFPAGTYTFDPATSLLKQTYPDQLFEDFLKELAIRLALVHAAVVAVASVALLSITRRQQSSRPYAT